MGMSKAESGRLGQEKSRIVQAALKQKRIDDYYLNPKKCMCCEKPLLYGSDKRKKYCSHICAANFYNITHPKARFCKNCNERLASQTIFCSHKCHHEYKKQHIIEDWLNGIFDACTKSGQVNNIVRKYIFEKSEYKCSKCSFQGINIKTGNTILQVNHIDGNYRNCGPMNLEILCPNCHAMTPTFGFLNKGFGRDLRRNNAPVVQ